MRRKLIILIATIGFVIVSPSNASLRSELDGMFSNVTAPGGVSSSLRMGFAGGGVGVRAPIKNINIVSLDPPRLSAGCGGIDLYGGSFSFINGDQFVALLRAIVANAVGVAFKAAIDAINPQLGNIMSDFQQIIQNLNQGLSNTCAIASTIVKGATSYLGQVEMTKSSVTGEQTASGGVMDSIANFTGGLSSSTRSWFNNSGELTEKAASNEKLPEVGNLVWKALGKSKIADDLGNPITGENSAKASKEFILSLLGTHVIGAGDQGKTSGEGRYDDNDAPPFSSQYAPTLSLTTLRDGSEKEQNKDIYLLRCFETTRAVGGSVPDGACNDVKKVKVNTDFHGISGYVNEVFFGTPEGKATGYTSDSIIGKIASCSETTATGSCNLTTRQEQLLFSIDGPALALLIQVQHSPTAMSQVADFIVPLLANRLAMSYAHIVLQTSTQAFDGKNQEVPPEFIRERQQAMADFLKVAQVEDKKLWDQYEKIQNYVESVISNDTSIVVNAAR